jgi:hypothetical protein
MISSTLTLDRSFGPRHPQQQIPVGEDAHHFFVLIDQDAALFLFLENFDNFLEAESSGLQTSKSRPVRVPRWVRSRARLERRRLCRGRGRDVMFLHEGMQALAAMVGDRGFSKPQKGQEFFIGPSRCFRRTAGIFKIGRGPSF